MFLGALANALTANAIAQKSSGMSPVARSILEITRTKFVIMRSWRNMVSLFLVPPLMHAVAEKVEGRLLLAPIVHGLGVAPSAPPHPSFECNVAKRLERLENEVVAFRTHNASLYHGAVTLQKLVPQRRASKQIDAIESATEIEQRVTDLQAAVDDLSSRVDSLALPGPQDLQAVGGDLSSRVDSLERVDPAAHSESQGTSLDQIRVSLFALGLFVDSQSAIAVRTAHSMPPRTFPRAGDVLRSQGGDLLDADSTACFRNMLVQNNAIHERGSHGAKAAFTPAPPSSFGPPKGTTGPSMGPRRRPLWARPGRPHGT